MSVSLRMPVTIISGALGSGKTTLLRHILDSVDLRLAIVMNEFGEIAIDARIIEGKNIQMAELGGGCVCCSLLGEFESAVDEIIETVQPDAIIVETTGLAEPEALAFDIQESLPQVRLDGIITVVDADATLKYPQLGHTERMQVESADLLLLNKIDLVPEQELGNLELRLRKVNEQAPITRTRRCQIDPDLLFGIARARELQPAKHKHQPEFESFSVRLDQPLDRTCFEDFADQLNAGVYRSKGFVRFAEGTFLFNFVAGRWDLEAFEAAQGVLVFIGKGVRSKREEIEKALEKCISDQAEPQA